MKEKLYAIPVNDAFEEDCECPVCSMKRTLHNNAVEYTMGPSYMEDDIRAQTDELGFCRMHIQDVYAMDNRLGMALVLKTHFDKIIRDIRPMAEESSKPEKGKMKLMKKKDSSSQLLNYIEKLEQSCFVCRRIDTVFDRYIDTLFYLWRTEESFRTKYASCKGFCTSHYGLLIKCAPDKLKGEELDRFISVTNELYIRNMERVRDDLGWFINKFDYKYANEPWKNAKDAIPRAITKTNSI